MVMFSAPVWWLSMWLILGWLLGFLVYIVGGFFAASVSDEWRDKAARRYSHVAAKILDGGVLVERGTKFDIFSTTHDGGSQGDKFTIDGETAHVTNESKLLSTFAKRDLGLIPPPEDNVATYVSPELAEFGEMERQRKEQGDLRDDDGKYSGNVTLDAKRPLVRLNENVRRMIPGNSSIFDLHETVKIYKESQRKFGQSKTAQLMILIIAFAAAMLAAWFVATNAGGAAPTNIDIPMGGF